jgi:hypothetical protein
MHTRTTILRHVSVRYVRPSGNNGFQGGAGPFFVTIKNNIFGNCGTQYVSSGATHGNYHGACSFVNITGNLYAQVINGHLLKTRAVEGYIANNRIFDGERGGASACIDIPNGGVYTIENNDIMKGPNAQSYSAVEFAEEGTVESGLKGRRQQFIFRNNRLFVAVPGGNHFGDGWGISINKINFEQVNMTFS